MHTSVKEHWALRQAVLVAFAAAFGIRADAAADPTIAGYVARQEELVLDSQAIIAKADAEKRELLTEERKAVQANTAEVERLQNEIELRTQVLAQQQRLSAPQPRQTPANASEPLVPADDDPAAAQRPQARGTPVQTQHLSQPRGSFTRDNAGFRNMSEFAHSVRRAVSGQGVDQRLSNAALTTYGNENTGADGGFAVPPEFRRDVEVMVMGEESLLSRCDAYPTTSNSISLSTDETTPWGTAGVRAYWGAEAAAMTQSKPKLTEHNTRLHKLHALVPLSEELQEDAPFSAALITRKAGEALQFKVNDSIINGSGVGQMLGILPSPALVTVAAEASQAADTVHAKNVAKMWARMPAWARSRAVWLANQDVEPWLMELGFQVGNPAQNSFTGGVPLYMPPGGLSAAPYATLLGKPVIVTEACPTIGDVGDLILAALPGYFAPFRSGGVKNSVSMHLWFDQDVVAFKWTLRIGGQPWLQAPIQRKSGSNTLSHFIALAAR